ncbi:uncharacterized protein FIBRA_08251 [Fibroporia radiculosa]|uniref:Uncharacterized protein n=1 Tax=Fibroporia radiculosa TaxID=599839 RepID=J4GGX7_9APHY|nr:uncharacterized protein FIBRA_08251 [Fibroporia radiculosa]CCM06008.1 predicted protein [Fibroporia radiculosa]
MGNPHSPDESSAAIYAEETILQGALLSNIVYGVQLALFAMCFTALVRVKNGDKSKARRQLALLVFTCVIFVIGTLFMGAQVKFTQLALIENRNYPGGPSVYYKAEFSNSVDEIANVCFVVGNWIMDAFLVWRFLVIFRRCGSTWVAALACLPCLMLLASVALGTTLLVQMMGSSPFSFVNITLSYYVLSLTLNILVTLLIVGRLLLFRRSITRTLGPLHASSIPYVTISAMLIESASLYSVFALLFLVPFGLNNALANVFIQTVSQVQIVASLLITFRVATGKAWTGNSSVEQMASCNGGFNLGQPQSGLPDSMIFAPSSAANMVSDPVRSNDTTNKPENS